MTNLSKASIYKFIKSDKDVTFQNKIVIASEFTEIDSVMGMWCEGR